MHTSVKQDNLKAIEKFHPNVFELINRYSSDSSSLDLKTEKSRSGELTISGLTKDKARIYLHSKYDPVKESEKIIDSWHIKKKDSNVLVLGFGLGYLPIAILEKLDPLQNLFIVESSIEIFLSGVENLDLISILDRPNTKFIIGPDFLGELKNHFKETDFKTVFFTHQPSHHLFPELAKAVSFLENITLPKLKKELTYPKFKSDAPKVLLFEAGFFIEKEFRNCLDQLRVQHISLTIETDQKKGESDFIKRLVKNMSEFKPDFIFSVNQWGFDLEGKLAEILTYYEIPFVCWYVDNPLPILRRNDKNSSGCGLYLLWDDYYIDQMKKLGFQNVEYLPYGVDSSIFHPSSERVSKKYPVSFVGNSLNSIIDACLKEINNESYLIEVYKKLTEKDPPSLIYQRETIDIIKEEIGNKSLPAKYLTSLEVAVNSKWTQVKRVNALLSIEEFKPHIFGDEGWKNLLPPSFNFHQEVNYHKELPEIYRSTAINLNISNVQLKNSVNQRLFDVCACGSFLLTDRGFAVQRFLTPGESVETFETYKELRKKVEQYLNYPEKQEEIAKKGCKTILAYHTYAHRFKDILLLLKEYFA